MANFRITVQVDSGPARRGTRRVKRDLNELERQAQRLNRVLVATFAGISTIAAVRQVVRLLDTYNQLENRLRVVTNGQQNLNAVFDELFGVAQRSRSSLEGTVELYSRLAISSKELGVNQRQLISFTESLNKAIIVSGASYREANQGLIQLSQGLASGTLRGDELRSVLEQLPVVADVIAKELGVTRGELRELGADGKITARDIITAFQNAEAEIEEAFAKTLSTISQSFQILRNNFVRLTGEFDEALGITELLARALLVLNGNLELLFLTLQILVPVIATRLVAGLLLGTNAVSGFTRAFAILQARSGATFFSSLAGAATVAARQTRVLSAAVAGLNLLLGANPIVRVVTAIVALISALTSVSSRIKVFGSDVITLADAFTAAFQLATGALSGFIDFGLAAFNTFSATVNSALDSIGTSASEVFAFIGRFLKTAANGYIGTFVFFVSTVVDTFNLLPGALADAARAGANALVSILQAAINRIIRGLNTLFGALNAGAQAVGLGSLIPEIAPADLSGLKLEYSGAGAELGNVVTENFQDAFNTDFIGDGLDAIQTRAQEIANARDGAGEGGVDESAVDPSGRGGSGSGSGGGGSGGGSGATFADIVAQLEQENDLLRVQGREREVLAAILDAEQQLKRSLTEQEATRIEQLVRENQLLTEQSSILEELNGPQQQVSLTLEALNGLLDQGQISLDQYAEKLRELRVAATETNNTLIGGLVNGLARVGAEANNLGQGVSEIVVGAFNSASDAVVEFAKTGEFNIRKFFGDIAQQLLNLATNQLLAQLINGLFGGFGGGGFNILGALGGSLPGFATGGQFEVGGDGRTDSSLVAFRATRGERVTVETPQQQRSRSGQGGGSSALPQPANVNVAAVLSESDVENALSGEAGDRVVIRALENNPNAARRILGV